MASSEIILIPLLIILALGLIIPELFKKLRIPFVTSLILIGSVLGPHGFDYIQSNEVIEFFGFLGMAFLMFMAGLETDLTKLEKEKFKIFIMAGLNGVIPFFTGLFIARFFGYPWLVSTLMGTIFVSSSVAIVIPSLESAKIINKKIGQLILSSILILDISSLVILSFILQKVSPITELPLLSYFIILIISVIALFLILPRITRYCLKRGLFKKTETERKLRFVIVLLIAVLSYFSALGVHPILAAFIAGLVLSTTAIKSELIYTKIHTLGYGLFVPVFFFIIGMQMNLKVFADFDAKNILMISIVVGLMLAKLISGFLGGKIIKFSNSNSAFFGTASMIQFTTTLAVTYTASSLQILDNILVTSIIMGAVITTIIGPIFLKILAPKIKEIK